MKTSVRCRGRHSRGFYAGRASRRHCNHRYSGSRLLLPAIQAAREAARRAQCQSSIKNVALALLNYESTKKIFPKGMTFNPAIAKRQPSPMVRWISVPDWVIEVLPYLEEQPLHDSFDLKIKINDNATNSVNRIARGAFISVLLCPSDSEFNRTLYAQAGRVSAHGDNWGRSNYAANAGRADIWHQDDLVKFRYMYGPDSPGWKDNCKRGVMGPNISVALKRITDGTSKTILVGEIRTGPSPGDARGVWAMGHAGASLLAGYRARGRRRRPQCLQCGPQRGRHL